MCFGVWVGKYSISLLGLIWVTLALWLSSGTGRCCEGQIWPQRPPGGPAWVTESFARVGSGWQI